MEAIYWTTKSGTRINVDHMDLNHLRNTLKMLIKRNSSVLITSFEMLGEIAKNDADNAMLYSINPELTCTCDEHHECQQCYEDRKNESDLNAFENSNY